ncbi:MAG: efflux RND transporter periplasmic adaptor subunit [Myxococcota bacterium]
MAEARRGSPGLRAGLLVAAGVLAGAGVFLMRTAPRPEPLAAAGEVAALRRVATRAVQAVEVRPRVEIAGVLESRRSVELFAETRGSVIELGAEELDRVAAGQLLVEIDPLLAEVAVESAAASLVRRESELALARSHLARRRSLAERGVASESDLEDAENAEKVAAAVLRESRAELRRARDDLSKKTIVAPFAGVLRSFPVEVGEYLREGEQLAELLDLSTARATIALSDREVVAVRAGQRVEVVVEAYPGEKFEGRILRVGAAADSVTKKFPIQVELPNAQARLLPGMVARVVLDLGESSPRTVIPRDATVDEFGLRFAYVIRAEGEGDRLVARRRRLAVRPMPFRPADFEVMAGLVEGEEIAVTGVRELRDGERVLRENGKSSRVRDAPTANGGAR